VHAKVLAEIEAGGPLGEQAEEVLQVIRTVAQIQQRHGPRAAGRYIVSFTRSAEDLANVHRLARAAVGPAGTPPVLDVIPLFETFADLQAAPRILAEIIGHPEFAARLTETGRRLEVMLGYSDSSKDVGPVAATLALYEAQQGIAVWARDNDIELTLFHGRGGALGRGGGPANSAILAQPPHSVDGRFKLTEQGEVIFARYGGSDIAMRHIDQVAAAVLLASSPSIETRNEEAATRFADVAATMDATSRERFFALVKAPGFAAWFATVTPMEEIGLLALGSRPARRGLSVESLEDLRAIPWVFSWTQARINLTGWFGLGSALEAVGDEALLAEAYRDWPLFRTMVDNVAMSLAKADGRIARHYLALGDRHDLADLVLAEMDLTRDWVVRLSGGGELLANKPVLQRAVKMRSPYVDALSLLQLRALRELREAPEGAPPDPELQRLLLLSVSGVAAGLQNTG
uniref:phosphoenolpyruvate carboxylase n=1 Tax=uncultured Amnibacterium sp. TaxID=1631851 RepID=UPI0035C9ADD1